MVDRARETELIEAFQAGSDFAFDQLVDLYKHRAYNLAYKWVENREDALDICQEAFLRMYRALAKWRPRSSIFTWLYRVIINLCIDLRRRQSRERVVPLKTDTGDYLHGALPVASTEIGPRRAADATELGGTIRQATMLLPKRQQKAFLLRFYEGLQIREIARIMRCSEGAVKASLFQAIRKMRKLLASEWQQREQGNHDLQTYQASHQISHLR
jgi:RNA polymerase sigma-70 factor (ECF subfamily)